MLELKNIIKDYEVANSKVHALKGISINFREHEFVSILGPSGCGKTTLLNIIGGLDRYTSGDLIINGKSTKDFKDKDWDRYRNHSIGFVFQSYNLIPHQTVLANVELALTLSGVSKEERKRRAVEVLNKVGLGDQLKKKPNQMSGGQMQRVAIARALINDPDILLADEPTGALDSTTSVQVMDILKEVAKDKLVIMVTHNGDLAEKYSSRIISLKDGLMLNDTMPYNVETKVIKEDKKKKKSMSFLTALFLSFNNLMTKKARTILTCFAGSIGIIGIALILSLSNGFQTYIDKVQTDTMSAYPLSITKTNVDYSALLNPSVEENKEHQQATDKIYSNPGFLGMLSNFANAKQNNMKDFKSYTEAHLENIRPYLLGITYSYSTDLKIYSDSNEDLIRVNPSEIIDKLYNLMGVDSIQGNMFQIFDEIVPGLDNEYVSDLVINQYDVLAGNWPQEETDIVLVVNENNEVNDLALYALGLKSRDDFNRLLGSLMGMGNAPDNDSVSWDYDTILSLDYTLVLPTDLYEATENGYQEIIDKTKLKNVLQTKGKQLKVSGIIRPKKGVTATCINGSIGYTSKLMQEYISENNKSEIIKKQLENKTIDVLTGEAFDESASVNNSSYEKNLKDFGYVDESSPSAINFYPKDFKSKDELKNYIATYNEEVKDKDKITYTDYVSSFMNGVLTIIDAISYVLIGFVSISLVVSSLMIGIITYISVLERTKEIGILRSIGASKKDISRVFNAETLIVGFSSGVMGILISLLLCIPISIIVQKLTEIKGISAILPPLGGVILIIISMLLTLLAGLIPSRIAAKKDPVVALRTE